MDLPNFFNTCLITCACRLELGYVDYQSVCVELGFQRVFVGLKNIEFSIILLDRDFLAMGL